MSVIEVPEAGDEKFDRRLTAYRLARFLSERGHHVSVRTVGHGDPQHAAALRRQFKAVS